MPSNDYKPTLIALMSFLHNVKYDKAHEFTREELSVLRPTDIERYMKFKAYGTADPGPDDNPNHCLSSSLEYWKKAISHYMPNREMAWNTESQEGNPTRSVEVNEIIKKVKTKEGRKPDAKKAADKKTGQDGEKNHFLILQSQLEDIHRTIKEIGHAEETFHNEMQEEIATLRADLNGLANNPAFLVGANKANDVGGGETEPEKVAALSALPRSLYDLWKEYQFGLGGRKPARFFTREERGKVKHKFHRRKVVWDCVSKLVNAGFSEKAAIDRIYQVYGSATPVTKIINRMKKDKQAGNIPSLLQV